MPFEKFIIEVFGDGETFPVSLSRAYRGPCRRVSRIHAGLTHVTRTLTSL
jgi:hypothetical protein